MRKPRVLSFGVTERQLPQVVEKVSPKIDFRPVTRRTVGTTFPTKADRVVVWTKFIHHKFLNKIYYHYPREIVLLRATLPDVIKAINQGDKP